MKEWKEVLTADIIESDILSSFQREELKLALDLLALQSTAKYEYFIRGDSFQVFIDSDGLREALKIKAYLKFHLQVAVRISIGIGSIRNLASSLSNSVGQAFTLSGRALDQMKLNEQNICIVTENADLNQEWQVHSAFLDYLEGIQTQSQAEAIYWLLMGLTQTEIAAKVGISQPSVNARLKSSAWYLAEKIINRYNQIKTRL